MTTKLEQAARQALEALIEANVVAERYQNADKRKEAITALREALANTRSSIRSTSEYSEQAEQEPVAIGAYEVVNENGNEWELVYPAAIHKYKSIPAERITQTFYTNPVRTKDLTDDELREIHHLDQFGLFCDYDDFEQIARAVIAADRKLNGETK